MSEIANKSGVDDPSGRKERKGWRRILDLPAWTGVLGTVIAIVGAVIAYEQIHLATVENQASEQQSLVTLVSEISQLRQSLTTASAGSFEAIDEASDADAAQGIALVDALHDRVPAIDNLELGEAFQNSHEYHQALISFARAATVGSDPHYRSTALREAAQILYYIGGVANDRLAETDIKAAYNAFDDQPDIPRAQLDNNRELTDLYAVQIGATADCAPAHTELRQADGLIAADRASGDVAEATAERRRVPLPTEN
jgi:hypothetical protein